MTDTLGSLVIGIIAGPVVITLLLGLDKAIHRFRYARWRQRRCGNNHIWSSDGIRHMRCTRCRRYFMPLRRRIQRWWKARYR